MFRKFALINKKPYIFKVTITGLSAKERLGDLESIDDKYSIFKTDDKTLIWEAKSSRMAGFFGEMSDIKKSVSVLIKNLKDSKLIN